MKKYSYQENKQIEQALVFMVNKITEYCDNQKPLILHCTKVGIKLMNLGESVEVVIAGLLHDLLEDTKCTPEEIEENFGLEVLNLVKACTFDKNIKDYKERWEKSLTNIDKVGRNAVIIKIVDQMDNLPYYSNIENNDELKAQVAWKHNYFIEYFSDKYSDINLFHEYQLMVNDLVQLPRPIA